MGQTSVNRGKIRRDIASWSYKKKKEIPLQWKTNFAFIPIFCLVLVELISHVALHIKW